MTFEEAEKVLSVIRTADHECSVCVRNLVELAQEAFPEFKWTYDDEEMEAKVEQI